TVRYQRPRRALLGQARRGWPRDDRLAAGVGAGWPDWVPGSRAGQRSRRTRVARAGRRPRSPGGGAHRRRRRTRPGPLDRSAGRASGALGGPPRRRPTVPAVGCRGSPRPARRRRARRRPARRRRASCRSWGPARTCRQVGPVGPRERAQLRCARGGHGVNGTRVDEDLVRDDQAVLARELINRQLEQHARDCLARNETVLGEDDEEAVARAVFDRIFNLGRLQPLIDDERISNIHANGHDQVFVEYEDGTKVAGPPVAASDAEFIELLREIGRRYGLSEREFNPGRPSLNLQLPDGSRLFAVAWVCDRPCLSIRRHRLMRVTLADLERLGTLDRNLRHFLAAAVRARKQLIIAGATGVGKTTLLRALAAEIPPEERIVTIETELELGLDRFRDVHPDCIALEAREANVEGVGSVTAADLVRMSLRMSPD